MKQLRVACLIHTYWPVASLTQSALADLSGECLARGHDISIVTSKTGYDWSDQLTVREVPVVRLPKGGGTIWGSNQYRTAVKKWLASRMPAPDGVLAWGCGEEMEVATRLFSGSVTRVIARVDHELGLQLNSKGGLPKSLKTSLSRADRIAVNSHAVRERLIADGIPGHKLVRVPEGFASAQAIGREDRARLGARQSLGKIHPSLELGSEQILVVCAAPMLNAERFDALLRGWVKVQAKSNAARLWLVGDGPACRKIAQRALALHLENSVAMPGCFDDLDDVLAAADLYVSPDADSSFCRGLGLAMSRGVAVAARDTPTNREYLTPLENGLLVDADTSDAWALAISRLLRETDLRRKLGSAAKTSLPPGASLQAMCDAYLQLVEQPKTNLSGVTS